MDGVVAPLVRPDRPGRPDVVGSGNERVVGTLPVDLANRVDRWQIHHVEPHGSDTGQIGRCRRERTVTRGAVVVPAARRSGKELVPGTEQRAATVDDGGVRATAGDHLTQRMCTEDLGDVGGVGGCHTLGEAPV
jgi:hypothetical protein